MSYCASPFWLVEAILTQMTAPKLVFTKPAAHKYELGFTRFRPDYAYKIIVAHIIGKAP